MKPSGFYLGDCMEAMREFPDKFFELAIVDPPYGIGCDGNKASTGGHGGRKEHTKKEWDIKPPDKEYFDELFRVSKNQIVWGANYYPQFLYGTMGWIFWDKGQDLKQSDGELAFTSFEKAFRRIVINRVELLKEGTIHPTQKPIKLYTWLLQNYAKHGDKILDTHVGSASSLIACYRMGFEYWGFELDADYYKAASERLAKEQATVPLFEPQEIYKQEGLTFDT
jgi:site-specific DNA-methyltransferase (adenine-specific)